MASTGRTTYKNDWQREHTDRIHLTVPMGRKEIIQDHARTRGESLNGFINRAINETMNRDPEKDKREQRIAQIVKEEGKSAERAEHDVEVEEALAILQREVPEIQEFCRRRKQELRDLFNIKPQLK